MVSVSRFVLVGLLGLASCTIRVEQPESEDSPDAECLELFETCVELAGESPGCTEVYQYCIGSVVETGTSGVTQAGGCEQTYIDCLEDGGDPDMCQPLLDMCMPPPISTSTTGPCIEGDPNCSMEGGATTEPGCLPDDPDCQPTDNCEQIFLNCASAGYDESACIDIQNACQSGSCQEMLDVCWERIGEDGACAEITGCSDPPLPDECMQILADCESQGISTNECAQMWPQYPECFPGGNRCDWYQLGCQDQFAEWFCADASEGCLQGSLPEVFDCTQFLDDACPNAGLSDTGCDQARQACDGGFFDIQLCNNTTLWEDPNLWLAELAECNMWQ